MEDGDRNGTGNPRVTVGLPVYNGGRYLERALDAILAQTYRDFELVISDNASDDRTSEICRSYAGADSRVLYLRNDENIGAAKNYNRLVQKARGVYFKWAAHDDLCASRYIEACVDVLDRYEGVVLCYPKTRIIDENGEDVGEYHDGLHLDSPRPHQRFHDVMFRKEGECNAVFGLIRTEVLRHTGLIGSYPASDMILLSELALMGSFYEVPEPLFLRRDHPETSVRANASHSARASWFDPKRKPKTPHVHWRWAIEYSKAIRRSGSEFGEQARCYRFLGRWMRWNRDRLAQELGMSVRKHFA